MLEKTIETKLRREVKAVGAECLKFVSPGWTGVPDRIVLIPGGGVCFVETKAPGKRERARQDYTQRLLRELGFIVFSSVDSVDKIDEVVRYCVDEIRAARQRRAGG